MRFGEQVLAVDLLNPSPAAEARKHKLKVRWLLQLQKREAEQCTRPLAVVVCFTSCGSKLNSRLPQYTMACESFQNHQQHAHGLD